MRMGCSRYHKGGRVFSFRSSCVVRGKIGMCRIGYMKHDTFFDSVLSPTMSLALPLSPTPPQPSTALAELEEGRGLCSCHCCCVLGMISRLRVFAAHEAS